MTAITKVVISNVLWLIDIFTEVNFEWVCREISLSFYNGNSNFDAIANKYKMTYQIY